MDLTWNNYFINMAQLVSLKSKDPSTKVGCVIVGPQNQPWATGFNGFAQGVRDNILEVPERYERPLKYDFTCHAERNAIDFSDRSLRGATAYLNWTPIPCPNCALGFIQKGIKTIIGPKRPFAGKGNWTSINEVSLPMLKEAGIEIIEVADYQFFVPLEL